MRTDPDQAPANEARPVSGEPGRAIIGTDLGGVIRSWSPGAERLFGYSTEEALGRRLSLLMGRQSAAWPLAPDCSCRPGEHAVTHWLTRAGQRVELSLRAEPIHDGEGTLCGIAWIAREPGEYRREDLDRARLAAIVDSSEDAIISKDLNGVIQSWNRSAERIFGYSAEQAVGRSIAMLIPPERWAEEEDILARIRRAERVEHYETVRMTREGRAIEVSLTISPVRDASGTIVGASKISRDVTERRRIERELAAQREWFRVTLSSIGEAVITCDVAGTVRFLNTAAEKLTGWSAADAVGQPLAQVYRIVAEESRQLLESPVARVLQGGLTNGDPHTLLVCRDGSERSIAHSAAPIRSAEHQIIGAALVFRDVSAERRVELALAEQREWRERLLESERAARAAAERISRLKDEFVATLSHELRTPLNAILGWTRVLQMDPGRPELVERGLEVIERNTHLQAQLVSDLLDMSRLISGKLTLDLRQADLPSIAQAAVESARPSAQSKGIALHAHIARPLAPLTADAARLQQVIWNLLSNAVKFTPAGGRIEVSLEEVDAEACLTVSDTGIGIQAEFLPSLFERFRQGDSAVNRRYGGLGLGLAIVKQLVELHGGSVQACSPGEGRGATFRVRLPLRRSSPAPEREAAALVHDPESGPAANLSGLRVLVVEDDADAAELLVRFLRDAGAQASSVSSAAQALCAVGELAPHVLVSDIGMPEVDGYELIRQLRASGPSKGGSIPAVAVTAFARPEDRTRALLAGYQAHVTKPVEPPELIATVRMLSGLTLERPREH